MRILDHEPQFWFLAEESNSVYLDANCSHGAVGYSFMIELSPQELAQYKTEGRPYLSRLAQAIQDSAPIAAGSTSIYRNRDVSPSHGERLSSAIQSWRKGNASI